MYEYKVMTKQGTQNGTFELLLLNNHHSKPLKGHVLSLIKSLFGRISHGTPLLIRLAHAAGDDKFQAQLVCRQPDFFNDLTSAMQKP